MYENGGGSSLVSSGTSPPRSVFSNIQLFFLLVS
jgi:hypothetical protein